MSYSLIKLSRTKARKLHACVWCGKPILRGSTYFREVSIYDGEFQSLAMHEMCMKASDEHIEAFGEIVFAGDNEMPFSALYALEASSSTQTDKRNQ